MRLGLRLPQRMGIDLRHDVTEVASAAERAGSTVSGPGSDRCFLWRPVIPLLRARAVAARVSASG